METTELTKSAIETITVKEFMLSKGFVSISNKVRVNTNKYPYLTFINANNEAENVYFSKNATAMVEEGDDVNRELLSKFSMAETTNAEGEKRWKLTSGEGSRVSLDALFD